MNNVKEEIVKLTPDLVRILSQFFKKEKSWSTRTVVPKEPEPP
jgi:hypothetical protein